MVEQIDVPLFELVVVCSCKGAVEWQVYSNWSRQKCSFFSEASAKCKKKKHNIENKTQANNKNIKNLNHIPDVCFYH